MNAQDIAEYRSFYGRRDSRPRLNLGSNELLNPRLQALQTLRMGESESPLNLYPLHGAAIRDASSAFGRSADELLLAPGSDAAIRGWLAVARKRGLGRLVLPVPSYPAWEQASDLYDIEIEPIPLMGDNAADFAAIARAAELRPSLVALTLPNAPIAHGSLSAGQALALNDICVNAGSVLVVDLCYAPFHLSADDLVLLTSRLNTILTFSKAFGLASARIATMTGAPAIVDLLATAGVENAVSQLALDHLRLALSQMDSYRSIWSETIVARDYLRQILLGEAIVVPESEANFIHAVVDPGHGVRIVQSLEEVGIRVKTATATPWRSTVRFAVPYPRDVAEVASKILEAWRESA